MEKTLALLLVASLLLAGCTELTDAVDEAGEEILNIEVDEDIALEQIDDFLTVDESESFGITVMYEIDMSEMGDDTGMLEVDEDATITMEMTEAWSPDGYHSSSVMGMDDGDMIISMITSMTHVGTTMYMSIGYEIDGELGADATEEETAEFDMMVAMMPEVEHFSMTTTTTHTEVIAAMAEASEEDSEDMDPMAFLEMIEMIEDYGTFTPADSVDGLQMFDVAIDPAAMMEDVAAEDVLEWCDVDDNGALSWSEFTSDDCDGEDDSEFETIFNDADTDMSGELTADELPAFIEAAMALSEEIPTPEEALDMCDVDASEGVSWDEFIAEDCDDTDSEDMDDLEAMFNQADADGSGEITMDELQGFIDSVSTFYETDMDDDMEMEEMPGMQVAFTSTGDIEYFSMEMEGTEVMMYILTEDRVNALFTDLDAGETVALPFSLSYDMYGGMMDDFVCDDGEVISSYQVNDGWEDCTNGEDEDGETHGGDDGGEDYIFYCSNDGEAYAEGMGGILCPEGPGVTPECPNGEDCVCIDVDGSCSDGDDDWGYLAVDEGMTLDDFGISSWDSTNDLQEIIDWFNENYNYGDGEPMLTVDDFLADCNADANYVDVYVAECIFDMASEMLGMYDDSDGDAPSPADLLSMADSDGDGELTPEEFFAFLEMDEGCCLPDEMKSDINDIMNNSDSDSSGTLSESELETFIMDFVSYQDSMEGGEDDGGMDDDSEMDMGDSDENHDHGDGGDDYSDEIVMYVTSDMDFHFEGDLSDYKIELATCESDYDMETGEETTTCTTVMSVAIADAGMDSDIMFHDADSSGTLSVGDMIHIGETAESWDEVRLYSISADAYSDENPMHDAPGFTGLVGMLALLGAAFIRRNE
ncbi:MAG: EF-hand domain-containing protein [Candidatus Poseidoniaceae archaeon]